MKTADGDKESGQFRKRVVDYIYNVFSFIIALHEVTLLYHLGNKRVYIELQMQCLNNLVFIDCVEGCVMAVSIVFQKVASQPSNKIKSLFCSLCK